MPDSAAVIGCGLIGGSFAMAFKRRRPDWTVTAMDIPERLQAVRDAEAADRVVSPEEMESVLPECGLVVLASPVGAILDLLPRIASYLRPGTVVTDTGSTKTAIIERAAQTMPEGVTFIGGHPMAGGEQSGVESADPLLFNRRVWILCPTADTPPDDLVFLINVIEDVRAAAVTLEPEEHDKLTAVISHAPQILAVALMHCALTVDRTHGMIETLAGRGFLDLTRIAASDYGMWRDIFATNRRAIFEALDSLETSIGDVRRAISEDDLETLWDPIRKRRSVMTPESLPRPRRPDLRKLIDKFDEQILKALDNRLRVVKRIGREKAEKEEAVYDPDRERRLLEQRIEWARALDLPENLVADLFERIMRHSKKRQETMKK